MSIYKSTEYSIYCDWCGNFVDFEQFRTKASAIRFWRERGWIIRETHKCPECAAQHSIQPTQKAARLMLDS